MKTKQVNVIEVQDFDKLVQETYGKPYSFQQQDGCKDRGTYEFSVPSKWEAEDYENETIPEEVNGKEMGVSFAAWLKRDPKEWSVKDAATWEVKLFWERNFYPNVDIVIEDLHKKGLISEGDYLIDIEW